MQIRYVIYLHKALTPVAVIALMMFYGNSSIAAWIYLSLHGTYGIL